LTDIKLIPDSLAIAFANNVLPGKYNMINYQKDNNRIFKTNHILVDQQVIHQVIEQIQSDHIELDDE
jgi:hypothetical protein